MKKYVELDVQTNTAGLPQLNCTNVQLVDGGCVIVVATKMEIVKVTGNTSLDFFFTCDSEYGYSESFFCIKNPELLRSLIHIPIFFPI